MRLFRTKNLLSLLGAAVALTVLGWGAWQLVAAPRDAVSFRSAAVERGDLLATIRATGTIEPEEVIDVGAQVAAQIKHFGADPSNPAKTIDYGSPVHAGTLLAQLDDALFKARVDQCRAALDEADAQVAQADAAVQKAVADLEQLKAKFQQAKRDYDRAQVMHPVRAISDSDYDAAVMGYDTSKANVNVGQASIVQAKAALLQAQKARSHAEANLSEAQVNLGYTQIRSPVEGVIVDRRVNVGQTVVAGLNAPSLFLIAKDLKRLQIWASVNEADIGNIRAGQAVSFTVDAYPKDTFAGQVAQVRLNATMTQNVVTYTVVVDTDNSAGRLLPYMTANLQFEVERRHDVLQVPNAALRWRPAPSLITPEARGSFTKSGKKAGEKESHDEAVLWVADGPFVRPIAVRIGMSDGVMTEVTAADLEPGMRVVTGTTRAKEEGTSGSPFAPKMFGGGKKS
jgi:HlyD family secretion protein